MTLWRNYAKLYIGLFIKEVNRRIWSGITPDCSLRLFYLSKELLYITRFPVHYSETIILLLVLIFTVGKVNLTFGTPSDKSGYIGRSWFGDSKQAKEAELEGFSLIHSESFKSLSFVGFCFVGFWFVDDEVSPNEGQRWQYNGNCWQGDIPHVRQGDDSRWLHR